MKKNVPFKKDLMFKTDVLEITSISLEHTLSIKDNSLINGNFLISGDYRITEGSTSLEKFSYEIPFEIHMDEKYILKNATIDIDDFYYEIINNKVLSVSIEVCIDNLEEKEIVVEKKEERKDVEEMNVEEIENKEVEIEQEESVVEEKERCIESEAPIEVIKNEGTESYKSYKVYIVREGDTIDTILTKYGVTKSELEDYNDLENLTMNDKVLIPCNNETAA